MVVSSALDNLTTFSLDLLVKPENWSTEAGKCYHTFRGHRAAIVCVSFNLQSTLVETSMDITTKLWHIEKEEIVTLSVFAMLHTLKGCQGEIDSEQFTWDCSLLVTGSMDKMFMVRKLSRDHNEEILDVCFDYMGQCIATAYSDGTGSCSKDQQVYNAETKKCITKLEGHRGENSKGAKIAPSEYDPD
ncbi:LOW QUALITY PROTEIN: dynein assembly factor with WD repeat domains 1 [Amazona ochrocephala]